MTIRDIWFRSVYAVLIVIGLYLLLVCVVGPRFTGLIITALTPMLGAQGAAFALVILGATFPVLLTVGVFTAVDRYTRARRDGELETRCRKCRHILRGLTEPRCPECGEPI